MNIALLLVIAAAIYLWTRRQEGENDEEQDAQEKEWYQKYYEETGQPPPANYDAYLTGDDDNGGSILIGTKWDDARDIIAALSPFHPYIEDNSAAHKIGLNLIRAIIWKESTGKKSVKSRSGAMGLMQICYTTAKGIGYTGTRAGLLDAETNVYWGTKYFRMMMDIAGNNERRALQLYNGSRIKRIYADNVLTIRSNLNKIEGEIISA